MTTIAFAGVFGFPTFVFLAAAGQAQQFECAPETDPAAADVLAVRTAFNKAIVEKDIDAIAAVLADDVILVTGTDSDIFTGRDKQTSLWEADFAADHRTLYERTSQCVSVSPLRPIALETGVWRGVSTANAGNFTAGTYAAKWRLIDGAWRVEAEIY